MKSEVIERLKKQLEGRKLIVASFREPYTHTYEEEEIVVKKNSGGVVTALDPLMKATNGVWVSFGLGDADKETVNEKNQVKIESSDGSYTLKRVFIPRKLENAYSEGACNSALWPLSHVVYVRPKFSDADWKAYTEANKQLAEAIAEVCDDNDVVWVNDYQLILVGQYLKKLKPKATVAFFWHIPWPSAGVFRIFPWANEVVEGMLAYDIVGFHTQYYATNFLNTIDATLEAKVDRANFTAQYQGSNTVIVSIPISVDYEGIKEKVKSMPSEKIARILKKYGLKKGGFAIGVDRMDYTKGIREKIMAVDMLLQKNPDYAGKFVLVQIASPTRLRIPEYQQAAEEAEEAADEINWRNSAGKWKPVILLNEFADYDEILALYAASNMCVVTSLHDGMNLVCKEYVSASDDGVLVLSKFAGAAQEMPGALLVNPYSLSDIANAYQTGLQMDKTERQARLEKMHLELQAHDVFNWASHFLDETEKARRRRE